MKHSTYQQTPKNKVITKQMIDPTIIMPIIWIDKATAYPIPVVLSNGNLAYGNEENIYN